MKRKNICKLLLLALMIVSTNVTNQAFRSATAQAADGDLKWSFSTGGDGSPAIGKDGTIYVRSDHHVPWHCEGTLYAINPSGTLKWKRSGAMCYDSPPTIGNDNTIYYRDAHSLHALTPDGTTKWKRSVLMPSKASPAVGEDGTIYLSGMEGVLIHAINPDGTTKWTYKDYRYNSISTDFSPAIARDGTIYTISETKAYAINPNGTLKWRFNNKFEIISLIVGGDDTVYITGSNRVAAINSAGTFQWTYNTKRGWISSPSIGADGTIYLGSDFLYAINPNGTLKWKSPVSEGASSSTPAVGKDGTIYVGAVGCFLYAINPDGSRKWTYATPISVYSSPTVASDGTVYFTDDSRLYAIDTSSKGLADSPWPMFHHDAKHTSSREEPKGFLTVTIAPSGAIDAGAQWAINDNQTWQASGTKLSLPLGRHYVRAKGVRGWGEPMDKAVDIVANQTTSVEIEYVYDPTENDYVTLKYDSAGKRLWAKRYNGPGNWFDYAVALALDASGNVYVTGYSWSNDSYSDYATIKYDSAGAELWRQRYDAPSNNTDTARAIAVDSSGNVYVAGDSFAGESYFDCATVKYTSSGKFEWAQRYNGDGNHYDGASAIATDKTGNVYVTGGSEGSNSKSDYATLKYDASGKLIWIKRYNGLGNDNDWPTAMAVDGAGNVHVTGYSRDNSGIEDYATLKYDTNGKLLWSRRYNGPGKGMDMASAIALDSKGNVCVTGYSVSNGSHYDITTVKYDHDGNLLWEKTFDGFGTAIAVDQAGNVYVTGTGRSLSSTSSYDYLTLKYDPTGTLMWSKRYDGPGKIYDGATAMAVDESGNVYVTGTAAGANGYTDYATLKYDTAGDLIWVRRYTGPGKDYHDEARAIAVDANGQVYVTGTSW